MNKIRGYGLSRLGRLKEVIRDRDSVVLEFTGGRIDMDFKGHRDAIVVYEEPGSEFGPDVLDLPHADMGYKVT